ncbi:CHAP domain-containing protein [Staphylococcus durrellii]|uniref:CHAP domain-containing protein n=1 Tax=Staphylococcus durrellii TaxID=2781773 RepID=UPI00189DB1DA|nr:CHAP domain-containing protein [Staphylococcus durrellii]MBF7017632.1 CHAP domain-containing protein [Staphylococcus durrellii]
MKKTITSSIFSLSLIGLLGHSASASQSHTVSGEETQISILAEKYASTTSDIIKLNAFAPNTTYVVEGTTILLPNEDIVEVKTGDTLYKISTKYKVSLERIYELNPNLTESIQEGQLIAITEKGSAHLSPFDNNSNANTQQEQFKPSTDAAQQQTYPTVQTYQYTYKYNNKPSNHYYMNTHAPNYELNHSKYTQQPSSISQRYNVTGHNNYYDWGQCTYYAFDRRQQLGKSIGTLWGDANNWASAAQNQGFKVNNQPSVGAVFQTTAGPFGHVGVVEKTNQDGSIVVSEMNWQGLGKKSYRTITNTSAYQYIH